MCSVYQQLPLFPLEKRCTRCGLVKPVTEFGSYHRRGKERSYIRSKCLVCMRAYDRAQWPKMARAKRAAENRQRIALATEKRCVRCGLVKPRDAFGPRPGRRSNMRSECKQCAAEAKRLKHPHTDQGRRTTAKQALWTQGLQKCRACGEIKQFEDFYRDQKRSHGHQSHCKVCVDARNVAWTQAWTQEQREAHAAYQKRYRRTNTERINATKRVWAKAHPLVRLAKQSKRVSIQRRAPGSYTADDIRALLHEQEGCCAYCGCRVHVNVPRGRPDKATVDHIVPITRGGSNWPENLCIACARCNSSKSNKLLSEWRERPYAEEASTGTQPP